MSEDKEVIELLKELAPGIYNPVCRKILTSLYQVSRYQYGLTYQSLLDVTELKPKETDPALRWLKRKGLVRVYHVEDRPTTMIVDPTDAGLIVGRSLPSLPSSR